MYLLTNLARMNISFETVEGTDGESSVYFICAENLFPWNLSYVVLYMDQQTKQLTAGFLFNFILRRNRKGGAFSPILMADSSC